MGPDANPRAARRLFRGADRREGGRVDEEMGRLLDRWIIAFLDPPAVLDADLMRSILDEHDAGGIEDGT